MYDDVILWWMRIVYLSMELINIWNFFLVLKVVENFVYVVLVFVKLENFEIVLIYIVCYNYKGLMLKIFFLIIIILFYVF